MQGSSPSRSRIPRGIGYGLTIALVCLAASAALPSAASASTERINVTFSGGSNPGAGIRVFTPTDEANVYDSMFCDVHVSPSSRCDTTGIPSAHFVLNGDTVSFVDDESSSERCFWADLEITADTPEVPSASGYVVDPSGATRNFGPFVVEDDPSPDLRTPDPCPATNRPPVATCDVYTVEPGGVLQVPPERGVLANDTDADGDLPLRAVLQVTSFPRDRLDWDEATGAFTFRPNFEPGVAEITYVARDSRGAESAPTTVRIGKAVTPGSPCAVEPQTRAACSASETGMLVKPRWQASAIVKLFMFEPRYTFRFSCETANILTLQASGWGEVVANDLVQGALKKLGYTLSYVRPKSNSATIHGTTAFAPGGRFGIAFDLSAQFDRFGGKKFVQQRLGKQLEKRLRKILKKYGPSYRTLREVRKSQTRLKKRILLEFDKQSRKLNKVLPDRLVTKFRTFIKSKVKGALDKAFKVVNAGMSSHGLGKMTAEEISAHVMKGVMKKMSAALTFHFSLWEPQLDVVVFSDGRHRETLSDTFKNPFVSVKKLD